MLHLPQHHGLESRDDRSFMVENPTPERNLRKLPSNRWAALELCNF
jgi:hypothetical protein